MITSIVIFSTKNYQVRLMPIKNFLSSIKYESQRKQANQLRQDVGWVRMMLIEVLSGSVAFLAMLLVFMCMVIITIIALGLVSAYYVIAKIFAIANATWGSR